MTLGSPQFPEGEIHEDKFFGKQVTYRREVRILAAARGRGRGPGEALGDLPGLRRYRRVLRPAGAERRAAPGFPGKRALLDLSGRTIRSSPYPPAKAAAGEDLRFAGVLEGGRLWAVVVGVLRRRPAPDLHALRPADDPDSFGDHRRRGPQGDPPARGPDLARLRPRHGGDLYRHRDRGGVFGKPVLIGAAERVGARGLCRGVRPARIVDVRFLRAATALGLAVAAQRRRATGSAAGTGARSC